jgi:hypothetical protein
MSLSVHASPQASATSNPRPEPPRHCIAATEKALVALCRQYGVEPKHVSVATGVVLGLWVNKRFVPGDVIEAAMGLGYLRNVEVDKPRPDRPSDPPRSWFRFESGLVELRVNGEHKLPSIVALELQRKTGWPTHANRVLYVSRDKPILEQRQIYCFGQKRLVVTFRPGRFPTCVED